MGQGGVYTTPVTVAKSQTNRSYVLAMPILRRISVGGFQPVETIGSRLGNGNRGVKGSAGLTLTSKVDARCKVSEKKRYKK